MVIIFLILAFLRSLHGVPIQNPTSDIDTLMPRDGLMVKSDDANIRSKYDLVKSCVLTVLACVWTSAHPNIPGPRDSTWTVFKRRLVMMACALIAPEIMAFWALNQWDAARKIADDYNAQVLRLPRKDSISVWKRLSNGVKSSLWVSSKESLREFFVERPKERARRGKGQTWTTTHGFFIQMGGFLLYENDYPKQVLDYDNMEKLIRNKQIDAPIYTEADIHDRSKGDTISKAVVVLQTTWFVIQCIARLCKGLQLSELEVVTLGFALLNGIIYAVWWNKPQGVGLAIFILSKAKKGQPSGDLEIVDGSESSQTISGGFADTPNLEGDDTGVTDNLQARHEIDSGLASRAAGASEQVEVEKDPRLLGHLETHEFNRLETGWLKLQKLEENRPSIEQSLGKPGEYATRQETGGNSAERESKASEDGASLEGRTKDEDAAEPGSGTPLGYMETDGLIPLENTPAEQKTTVKNGWLRRQLQKDRSNHHPLIFLFVRVPYRCGQFVLRPLNKIAQGSSSDPAAGHRVPMFYTDKRGDEAVTGYASLAMGTVFGAVHLLAWSSAFPSRTELLLWRISTLIIIIEPVFILIAGFLDENNYVQLNGALQNIVRITAAFTGPPLYIIARLTLIILSFLSLHNLPLSAFVTIPWTSFIPHL